MKLHTLAFVKLSDRQFETVDDSDLDFRITTDPFRASSRLFALWDWQHGLTRSQQAAWKKFRKAVDAGADFVIFTK